MLNTPIIEIKNVSKKYQIKHQQGGYVALRDVLANVLKSPFKFLKHKAKVIVGKETEEEFWALKDVGFNIEKGDTIGVIGHNGAGKSTLLKILTGITPPTTGEVIMRGRVASLLEVGTGFHPELTGRENIFLNGAILGMSKKEIVEKFDEIVKFSGVEKFLDTPVKRYSSGMYVRLAFSVAAHMEPDILLVDEVLAVGDAEFQKKCLGKMDEVTKKAGRTIIFVSHNMEAIKRLCNKCVLLENGQIKKFGKTDEVIEKYKNKINKNNNNYWENSKDSYKNDYFSPKKMYITSDTKGNKYLNIESEIKKIDNHLTIGYALYSEDGILLYWTYQTDSKKDTWPKLALGHSHIKSRIPQEILNNQSYIIELIGGLHYKEWLFEPNKNNPKITLEISKKLSDSPYWTEKRPGIIAPSIKWLN